MSRRNCSRVPAWAGGRVAELPTGRSCSCHFYLTDWVFPQVSADPELGTIV